MSIIYFYSVLILIFAYSTYKLLYLYFLTKGTDYIIFALLILTGGVGGLLLNILDLPTRTFALLSIANTVMAYLLFIQLTYNSTREIQKPKIRNMFIVYLGVYCIISVVIVLYHFSDDWRILQQEVIRAIFGIYLYLSYKNVRPFIKFYKTIRVQTLWKYNGLVYFITGLSIFLIISAEMLVDFYNLDINFDFTLMNLAFTIRVFFFFVFQTILILYIALLLPEHILISYSQIMAAGKLYDQVEKYDEIDFVTDAPNETLLEYILEIRRELYSNEENDTTHE